MKSQYSTRPPPGFSMAEVLLTLALAAVIAAASCLSAANILNNSPLRRSSQELTSILDNYAARAILEHTVYTCRFREDSQEVEIRPKLATNSATGDSSVAFYTHRLPTSVVIEQARFAAGGEAAASLILYADGSASPGSITLADQEKRKCKITQSLRGRRTLSCPG